jgi:hypothetical protein
VRLVGLTFIIHCGRRCPEGARPEQMSGMVPAVPDLLLVAQLSVASSYGQNVSVPADVRFDTIQFHLSASGEHSFRIRTFVLDHDIHVHRIDGHIERPVEVFRDSIDRAYGDVLASVHEVSLDRLSTQDLVDAGLTYGELEQVPDAGYVFWNPDGARYRTQSEPALPGERDGMAEVVYLGGIARFWLPGSWRIEMSPEEGGQFYDPDGDSVLRLNVLTFDTSAATAPPKVRHTLKPGERAIDGGRLTTGHEFDVYEFDVADEGTRMRYWQIAQVLPGQCRIFLFSYAYAIEDEDALTDELAMVDREVRRMVPYPEPV